MEVVRAATARPRAINVAHALGALPRLRGQVEAGIVFVDSLLYPAAGDHDAWVRLARLVAIQVDTNGSPRVIRAGRRWMAAASAHVKSGASDLAARVLAAEVKPPHSYAALALALKRLPAFPTLGMMRAKEEARVLLQFGRLTVRLLQECLGHFFTGYQIAPGSSEARRQRALELADLTRQPYTTPSTCMLAAIAISLLRLFDSWDPLLTENTRDPRLAPADIRATFARNLRRLTEGASPDAQTLVSFRELAETAREDCRPARASASRSQASMRTEEGLRRLFDAFAASRSNAVHEDEFEALYGAAIAGKKAAELLRARYPDWDWLSPRESDRRRVGQPIEHEDRLWTMVERGRAK